MRESEERFRKLSQAAFDGILIHENGYLIDVNERFVTMYGVDKSQLIGKSMFEMISPEHHGIFAKKCNVFEEVPFEVSGITPQGQNLSLELVQKRCRYHGRDVFIAAVRDLTENKIREKTILDNQHRLKKQNRELFGLAQRNIHNLGDLESAFSDLTRMVAHTLEVHRTGVWMFEQDDFVLKCAKCYNRQETRFSSGETIRYSDCPRYFNALSNQRTLAVDQVEEDSRTSDLLAFRGNSPTPLFSILDAPVYLRGKQVGIVHNEFFGSIRNWTLDEQNFLGSVADFVALSIETMERDQFEQSLRENRKWLSTILHSVSDAVLSTDKNGVLVFFNRSAQNLLEKNDEELIGASIEKAFDVVDELTLESLDNPGMKVLKSLDPCLIEEEIFFRPNRDEDRILPVSMICAPMIPVEGTIEGCVLVLRDLSQKRVFDARLRQQQKLESLGTLASGVAHEINNPINSIMNYAELIRERAKKDDSNFEYSTEIISETERVADIVRNLLAFARQEKATYDDYPIQELLTSVLKLIASNLKKDRIQVELDFPEKTLYVYCRRQQIQQVLLNLITNAKDALNERYPESHENKKLTIRARSFEKGEQQWVRMTFTDYGTGISPKHLGRIFDPFFTTKPKDVGTGLGLSLSHGIVTEHGGELRVESRINDYTRFILELRNGEK